MCSRRVQPVCLYTVILLCVIGELYMADVVITLKMMPASPEVDLDALAATATQMIAEFGAEVGKTDFVPIGFGIRAVQLIFVMDEAKGSPDALEERIGLLEDVESVEITDVRRALG